MYGLVCWAFCDFGDKFEIIDTNGEESKEMFISKISKVTCSPKKYYAMHSLFVENSTIIYMYIDIVRTIFIICLSCRCVELLEDLLIVNLLNTYQINICNNSSVRGSRAAFRV